MLTSHKKYIESRKALFAIGLDLFGAQVKNTLD